MSTFEEEKKLASKGFTKAQLKRRNFCKNCKTWKGKASFLKANNKSGWMDTCIECQKKIKKKKDLQKKLLAHEIYVEGASQPVVDRVVAGRELVSKASLAAFLDVHERTVSRLVKKGELKSHNFLGHIFFRKEDVEKWLEEKIGKSVDISGLKISQ
jgi:excisionase family DNA binding protein